MGINGAKHMPGEVVIVAFVVMGRPGWSMMGSCDRTLLGPDESLWE